MKQLAGALFGGIIGGFGGGSSGLWMGLGAKLGDPVVALSMWVGTVALSFLAARGFFSHRTHKREQEVQALAGEVAAVARDSIEDRRKKR
jgi:hypothetical protein